MERPSEPFNAAISIRDGVRALKLPFASSLDVHAGVATGVTAIHVAQGIPRFTGDAINLAARLQSLAQPGEILVGSTTRDLVAGVFELEPRGSRSLKGFSQVLPVWSVRLGPASQEEHKVGQVAAEAPFVGRRRELEMVLDRWVRVTEGSGQPLLIVGEPGIGKSRLVRQFLDSIEQPLHRIRIECDSRRTNAAFFPFVMHLQESAGVAWQDAPQTKLLRVREHMKLPDSEETAAWLSHLLGIDPAWGAGDFGRLRQRIIAHLIAYFRALEETKPLVLIVEDAQWIDPSSAELTAGLARDLRNTAAFIVITARSAMPLHKLEPVMENVSLSRLSEEESAELVVRLVGEGTLDFGRVSRSSRAQKGCRSSSKSLPERYRARIKLQRRNRRTPVTTYYLQASRSRS